MIQSKRNLVYIMAMVLLSFLVIPNASAVGKDDLFFSTLEEKKLVSSQTPQEDAKLQKGALSDLGYVSKQVFSAISVIEVGTLRIEVPEKGFFLKFTGSQEPEKYAVIRINDLAGFSDRVASRGEIGLGESYEYGMWDSPNLRKAMEILKLNQAKIEEKTKPSYFNSLLFSFYRWVNKSSESNALKNIQFHYDLGNAFYKLWLDESMTYSCAWFNGQDLTLAQAQQNKYNRVLGKLDIKPGDKILEIGCGWGGFAEAAAAKGYFVTGITLSKEQLEYAKQRAKVNGFADRVTFRLQDYRDVTEQYDAVVSIGIF